MNMEYVSYESLTYFEFIVIASIRHPSTNMLLLFDNILLLMEGRTVYYGPPGEIVQYFQSLGYTVPPMLSPPELVFELTDLELNQDNIQEDRIAVLLNGWEASLEKKLLLDDITFSQRSNGMFTPIVSARGRPRWWIMQLLILLHRMALV